MKYILCLQLLALCSIGAFTQKSAPVALSESIRLNQIGFYPDGPKAAVAPASAQGSFYIASPDLKRRYFKGALSAPRRSAFSDKTTRIADFSAFRQTGRFVVYIPGLGKSYPFEIKSKVHRETAKAALKAFYFQRMSTPLPERYAGVWNRAAGHPDRVVLIHPSAASKQRPAGTVVASPGGWYDAGDYNKYVVNSGITMGTLLSLYEDFPIYFETLETNIPESGNGAPDLLDEVLWNLRWMLTMQDPSDGGVYHKCTTAAFEGFVAPSEAHAPRYMVQKSAAAALDFAAVTAQAARVFAAFGQKCPGLADSCLNAARKAWDWAEQHPDVIYNQTRLNERFDPDIQTGAYGDGQLADERIWAAAELYTSTREDRYLQAGDLFSAARMSVQSWSDVRMMAYFTLLRHSERLSPAAATHLPELKARFRAFADSLITGTNERPHQAPMENNVKNYVWGSMAVCANIGMALTYAYRLSEDEKYLDQALANLDYILGRNPTGYSFVTGYGSKTPLRPHHRPSATDQAEAPVPGLLIGGPNPGQQDKCPGYPNKIPDESFVDSVCSYASNEVAINWNAPLAYLAFAMDILHNPVSVDTATLFDRERQRLTPVAFYQARGSVKGAPLVVLSHGYGFNKGGDYLAYSYLAEELAAQGYFVASIQHELPTDSLLPLDGVLQVVRRPFWERGADNIRFVIETLRKTRPDLNFQRIALIGHSNGGDITALFPQKYPGVVAKIITLDNRRMALPRDKRVKVYSLRSSDQAADASVLPTPLEQKKYGIRVVKLPNVRHNDMDDHADAAQRATINRLVKQFLAEPFPSKSGF